MFIGRKIPKVRELPQNRNPWSLDPEEDQENGG